MTIIYLLDARTIGGRYDEAVSMLPGFRRDKIKNCTNRRSALLSVGTGLLLRFYMGVTDGSMVKYSASGKPFVPGGPEFNLTHGGCYAGIAVGEAAVGVDIEPIEDFSMKVAKRCFTQAEREWADGDKEKLCELWTLKESVIKAAGEGFSVPLSSFSVRPELEGTVPGGNWNLFHAVHDGHSLSAASKEAGEVKIVIAETEELFEKLKQSFS